MSKSSNNSTANTTPERKTLKSDLLLRAISSIITEVVGENDKEIQISKHKISSKNDDYSEAFKGKKAPSISINLFLQRFLKYSNIEESTLIISLIYLDRYCEFTQTKLQPLNIHRLVLCSTLAAIKYNEDDYFANSFYAKVGGVTMEEINKLENKFITGLDFALFIYEESFTKYSQYLYEYNKLDI